MSNNNKTNLKDGANPSPRTTSSHTDNTSSKK